MDKLVIKGGIALKGELKISGAKNSSLPLMAACLLTEDIMTLTNVPHLQDVVSMTKLLEMMGVNISMTGHNSCTIRANEVAQLQAPYEIVRTMRASIAVLAPLLTRFGKAKISLPGGCAIGTRPVDFHIMAMEALGAKVNLDYGYIIATIPESNPKDNKGRPRLKGNKIIMPKVSVMATENAMMAASLAIGKTIIYNAACEPEVKDLGNMLNLMGAKIRGIGTDKIEITGVEKLHGTEYRVISDRLEAITYAICALATKGELTITNTDPNLYELPMHLLKQMGADIELSNTSFLVRKKDPKQLTGINIETASYPEFPTDLQAQFMTLACLTNSPSIIREKIFENRFMHVSELIRMGADITISGDSAMINPIDHFKGAEVIATDLRASVALIIAALSASSETTIRRIYHLDRGYEHIDSKLQSIGACVNRIKDTNN